jgi:phosphopantothenoylcysteine synthetase/decarboxylase
VTSGPTRAWIDPVRYIANASTGELGSRVADRFAEAGASVDYVAGVGAWMPRNESIRIHEVETPSDLLSALEELSNLGAARPFDLWIHAMAVLDYVPERRSNEKIPSHHPQLNLRFVSTPKVILRFKSLFPRALLVGFKLETTDRTEELRNAASSTAEKAHCDLVVANAVPFRDPGNHEAYFWEPSERAWTGPFTGKATIADNLFHWVQKVIPGHVPFQE